MPYSKDCITLVLLSQADGESEKRSSTIQKVEYRVSTRFGAAYIGQHGLGPRHKHSYGHSDRKTCCVSCLRALGPCLCPRSNVPFSQPPACLDKLNDIDDLFAKHHWGTNACQDPGNSAVQLVCPLHLQIRSRAWNSKQLWKSWIGWISWLG